MLRWALLAVALMFALHATPASAQDSRFALVVGVAAYRNQPALNNPANDARLIGPPLTKLGFKVETVVDPDYDTLRDAVLRFGRQLEGANVALFFYSGHGMQVNGHNYLLPVSAKIERPQDLRYEAYDAQDVLDEMDAPGRVNLMFLDACRKNPFATKLATQLGTKSAVVGRGLAIPATIASGTFISFAAAPGETASDGTGRNSPFTEALGKHLTDPGVDIHQLLTRVRVDIIKATDNKQRPWDSNSLDAEFYFVAQDAPHPLSAPVLPDKSTESVF